VMLGPHELDGEPRARFQPVERARGDGCPRSVEEKPMDFGHDEVRGQERETERGGDAEEGIGFGVMLVAGARQGDPGAAIDEQACGFAADVLDPLPGAPQRWSPRSSD